MLTTNNVTVLCSSMSLVQDQLVLPDQRFVDAAIHYSMLCYKAPWGSEARA